MRITKKQITLAGLGLIAVSAGLLWLRPDPVSVQTGTVGEGPMEASVQADGRTRVRERFVVRAPVSGRVERLSLTEGASVRRGDVVARVAPLPLDQVAVEQAVARVDVTTALERDAAARVRLAAAALHNQRRELERAEKLLAAGAIAARDAESARLALRSSDEEHAAAEERANAAAADVRQARAALLSTGGTAHAAVAVRAPADGRILLIHEKSERVVMAGAVLVELGDPRSIEVVVDVLSADAATIARGDIVHFATLGTDNGENELPMEGRVRLVEPSGFTKVSALGVDEQRVNVIIDLLHTSPVVGDGYRVDARIVTWHNERTLRAPVSALVRDGDSWLVFVFNNGRARGRRVQVGHIDAAWAQVLSGLKPGDEVILFPSDEIRDGTTVKKRLSGT
jgi:HlyD family secretion protein